MELRTHRSMPNRCLMWIFVGLVLGASNGAFAESLGFPCSDWGTSVVVDGSQRTIVGGAAADNRVLEWESGHAHYGNFALARLDASGRLDPSFGDEGSFILDEGDFDSVADLALDSEGVIVGGTTQQRDAGRTGPRRAVVFRLDDDGELDESFGDRGIAGLGLGGSEAVESVAAGREGDVYVAGTLERAGWTQGFVARLDDEGRLDPAFGNHGVVYLGALAGMHRVHGMRRTGGALLVAGARSSDGTTEAMVVRLNRDGRLTRRFADAGVATVEVPHAVAGQGTAFFSRRGATAVSLQVVAEAGSRIATVVFDPRGHAQQGTDGYLDVLDAPTGALDFANAGAFLWGRAMYLAGATYPQDFATGDAFLARKRAQDAGYDVTSAHFDLEYAAYNDLAVNRKTVTAVGWNFGEADDTLPPSDALVVRYLHDGRLDTTFGDAGVLKLDFMRGQAVCGPRVVDCATATC
ncbi:MAG: hypothetical protein MJD61_05130 [Proteobacteria bacterium]|nr:hypothetical protein [Pseudomonadota bacterium]